MEGIFRETNIWVIDASAETEGAGESGKGYEVITPEVRRFAERCHKVTGMIIEASAEGLCVIREAGEILIDFLPAVQKYVSIAGEISLVSVDQHHSNRNINDSLKEFSA